MDAVADTSALVDLAIPYVSDDINTEGNDDPLKVFLTVYDVAIPEKVEEELGTLWVGDDDLVADAARTVLSVSHYLTITNPLAVSESETIDDVPALEPGEVHALHLANNLSPIPAVFVTSEFGKNYDAIMKDQLQSNIICKSTPELLRDLGAKSHMDRRFVIYLLGQLEKTKGWDSEYIDYLRYTLR